MSMLQSQVRMEKTFSMHSATWPSWYLQNTINIAVQVTTNTAASIRMDGTPIVLSLLQWNLATFPLRSWPEGHCYRQFPPYTPCDVAPLGNLFLLGELLFGISQMPKISLKMSIAHIKQLAR